MTGVSEHIIPAAQAHQCHNQSLLYTMHQAQPFAGPDLSILHLVLPE